MQRNIFVTSESNSWYFDVYHLVHIKISWIIGTHLSAKDHIIHNELIPYEIVTNEPNCSWQACPAILYAYIRPES